jgi:hypothetical protein
MRWRVSSAIIDSVFSDKEHFDELGKQFCTCVTLVVLVENGQQPKRKRNPIG